MRTSKRTFSDNCTRTLSLDDACTERSTFLPSRQGIRKAPLRSEREDLDHFGRKFQGCRSVAVSIKSATTTRAHAAIPQRHGRSIELAGVAIQTASAPPPLISATHRCTGNSTGGQLPPLRLVRRLDRWSIHRGPSAPRSVGDGQLPEQAAVPPPEPTDDALACSNGPSRTASNRNTSLHPSTSLVAERVPLCSLSASRVGCVTSRTVGHAGRSSPPAYP